MNARYSGNKSLIDDLSRQLADLKGLLSYTQADMNALIELFPISVCIAAGRDGGRMHASRVLEELLGIGHMSDGAKCTSPWIQPNLKFFSNGRELRPEDLPIGMALETGRPVRMARFDAVRPDGRVVNISGNAFPLFDEEGQVRGAIGVFDDITERKTIEESLRKLSMAVEQSPESIVITDINGNIEYVNPKFTEVTGYTFGEALGQNPRVLKSGETPEGVYKELWGTILSGRVWRGEFLNKKKNGEYYWESASISPVKDEQGQITHFVAVKLDITERKRTEGLIHVRMQLMEYAATHSLEEILQETLNEIGRITCSPIGFYHFVEADQRTLTLQTWSARTVKEFCTAVGKGLHYPIDQAGVWVDCVHQRRPVIHNDYASLPNRKGMPEGHARVIRELAVPIMRGNLIVAILGVGNKPCDYNDKDVEVVAYLADVAWEIAERKRAEDGLRRARDELEQRVRERTAELRESEERLQLAQQVARIGTFEWNVRVGADSEMAGMRAVSDPPPVSGKDFEAWAEMIHPGDRARTMRVLQDALDKGNFETEYRTIQPDGSLCWLNARGRVFKDESGLTGRIIGVNIDITERKHAIDSLAAAKAEADLYVDLMGHDINNMNQISRGFLELAMMKIELEHKLACDDMFLLDKAIQSIDNSSRLIDNVRKLQSEKAGLYMLEVLDLGKIIGDAVDQARKVPGRDITINYAAAQGCYVLANQLLKDVFINLIGNAIRHSTGLLTINLEVHGDSVDSQDYWKVIVEDNGPGIPDIQKKTLFDRYNIPAIRAGGRGFGLYLIKTLVDDYHGKFRVEDRVQGDHTKGARFIVILPAVECFSIDPGIDGR